MVPASKTRSRSFIRLLDEVRGCTLCADELPLGPRPVLQADPEARVLLVGQAPGTKVHATGVPFNDPSGDRLRDWLGIDRDTFYDEKRIALLPMAFCYRGTRKVGRSAAAPSVCRNLASIVAGGFARNRADRGHGSVRTGLALERSRPHAD